jgi:hypothetical protein
MTEKNEDEIDQPLVSKEGEKSGKSKSRYEDDAANFSIGEHSKITHGLVE